MGLDIDGYIGRLAYCADADIEVACASNIGHGEHIGG